MKIFAGNASKNLAKEIAKILKTPLSKSETVKFANSEVRVRVCENVRNETAIVIQSTSNPTDTNLMELFLFCDALKREEAKKVIGVIPYFGYARQDMQHREGECVSANVVIRFLESIGFYKIYTINIHNEATGGVFSIPFKNIDAIPFLAEKVRPYLKNELKKVAVVSADQGGIERAREFGEKLLNTSNFTLSVVEKKRNLDKLHKTKALDLYGDVKGKIAIIVDDIVTSGSTLVNAAQLCKNRGAEKVLAVIVHNDFSKEAPQKIQNSVIDKLFSTNTIELKEEQRIPKLQQISVAPLIAKFLRK